MAVVNELIIKKLQKYPEETRKFAVEIVRAASEMPDRALQEYIEALLRKTIRNREE